MYMHFGSTQQGPRRADGHFMGWYSGDGARNLPDATARAQRSPTASKTITHSSSTPNRSASGIAKPGSISPPSRTCGGLRIVTLVTEV